MSATSSASVPEDTPIPCAVWEYVGNSFLELRNPRPEHEALAVADLANRLFDVGSEAGVLLL